jgi:hypothetical protein
MTGDRSLYDGVSALAQDLDRDPTRLLMLPPCLIGVVYQPFSHSLIEYGNLDRDQAFVQGTSGH